jgi:hypothetical protein
MRDSDDEPTAAAVVITPDGLRCFRDRQALPCQSGACTRAQFPAAIQAVVALLIASSVGACARDEELSAANRNDHASETSAAPAAAAPAARKEVPAPIEAAEVQIRESAPPQYGVRIVVGLPSGCAEFSRVEVVRQDAVVEVTVWNTVPSDTNVACAMIYGTTEKNISLGSDFTSGQTYTVRVNGEDKATFTAQ